MWQVLSLEATARQCQRVRFVLHARSLHLAEFIHLANADISSSFGLGYLQLVDFLNHIARRLLLVEEEVVVG